jgi:small conductance mechanosensitive channel
MENILVDNLEGLIELVSAWSLRVLGGFALLFLGLWIARMGGSATRRALSGSNLDDSLVTFLGRLVFYTIGSLVLISVLGIVGVETASLITVLGASSLAIGLALQGSLSNLASGVMLLVFRPYRAGDYVEVGENEGWIDEVGVFSTTIDTLDNVRVVLPNAHVAEQPIRNCSTNGTRRLDLEIEIGVDSPLTTVRPAIDAALRADSRVLADPSPMVAASDFGDTSIKLVVRPWCQQEDYWALRYTLPELVKDAIEAAGCSLPCPERRIHLRREEAAA